MQDDDLHAAFLEARRSERLQLLELLESKLERLAADKATRDQIISMLKDWISARRSVGAPKARMP
ncbi:Uncharacterised protein [Serratia ficaria]|uniref:hypothetical protein n=1 Tax=Serratia ficaria TaxID=61651 RepID=UPI002184296B|nr:hypothetical protein [Serratia ficaria]CAI2469883.1 Uncharacterised protein [Serratia ficaria]